MKNATMLYRVGKEITLDCGTFDTIIVDEEDVASKIKEGWALHPLDCGIDTVSAPSRKELEAKATELKIKFDGRMSDKTLNAKIEEALNVLE